MDLATWFAHIVSFTPKDLSSLFVLFSNLNMKKSKDYGGSFKNRTREWILSDLNPSAPGPRLPRWH